jgi:NTP pyrophosphatase (non-canonical NTP hydrolase)
MPIYEFYCPRNNRIYSFFARSLAYSKKTPRCPENGKWKMEKLISGFAITGRAREKKDPAGDPADDPRMEKMMAEMEREFSSLGDSENPDPRVMARAMRRMAEMTGEKTPAVMEEMLSRMEKGEDPEKLEAEYGDALGDMPEPGAGDGEEAQETMKAALRRLRGQPRRDATLYEMSDYCD